MGEAEAAGDGLTDPAIRTGRTEGAAVAQAAHHAACRNCGATLTGDYCATCGQPAHLHRSLHSLGHDILHGVFHFEGKIWRTIPELLFHPGRLTRRYIDGERTKFVSPMALFLFTVFLMFAVFSFTGGMLLNAQGTGSDSARLVLGPRVFELARYRTRVAESEQRIAELQRQAAMPKLTSAQRSEIETRIASETAALELARKAVTAAATGNTAALEEIDKQAAAANNEPAVNTGSPSMDRRFTAALSHIQENPSLVLYKLKSNGYKFSWALVPMSIPFLWLLFIRRRDVQPYDHAVFVTYSISFVMLLITLCSLASVAGVSSLIWANVLVFGPPIHLYNQLRGTYALSRIGAFVRLVFLQLIILVVLGLYCALLLWLGLLN